MWLVLASFWILDPKIKPTQLRLKLINDESWNILSRDSLTLIQVYS